MKLKQISSALMVLGLSPLALADFIIQDIRVEGLQRTEPSTVFSYLPVKVGDTFTDARSEEIIKKLYATGFFDDVRVETMGNQVLLTVIERPTIGSLNITGAKTLQADAIKKNFANFGLAQSQYFNPATLNQAIAGLQQEYQSRGRQSVKITPTLTKLTRNRVDVNIAIEEGKATKITDIEFEGNTHYSDRKLRHQMSLSEKGAMTWLTRSDRFNEEKFTKDMERINEFYQNNGYLNFRILNTDIQSNPDKTKQTIKVTVDEGQRFRWGKIRIEGDTREVPKEELYQSLKKIKEGRWYERQQLAAALETMQNRMGTAGYAFSEISVQPMPNPQTGAVDFVLNVEPGRKVYVNEINITGNNKTRDEVVRRELRQMEAAPYDTSKLQRSKERVELLGYFDNVQFDAKPVEGTPDQVDLDMKVTERSTGSLDMSAGWVQDTGIVVSAGVSQDNLFGTGKSASARLSRSKTTLNGSLSFTAPYFTPDGVSLGYDVYGKSYDPRKSSSDSKQYKTTTVGGGLRMGIPITEYDRINLGLAGEHLTVNTYNGAPKRYREFMQEHTGNEIGKFKGWLYKGTIGWGRNKTDNALWPTRGYQTNINGEIALPGSDLKYYSATHNQTWFFPLSKNFTLMLGGEVGYANGYGGKTMPFFENFYGGGLGSVRGFESGTLGPKVYDEYGDKVSYGGNKKANLSTELLFPMPGIKDSRTVRLSLFADAGSVWDGKTYNDSSSDAYYNGGQTQNVYGLGKTHKSTFKNELRYSAGAAVTWLSPLGPMKFSYAYPIKKKEGDEIQRFQFQLGTTF
ncbi:outer membrane protein assembly factor BamA [Neisseria chenwenguii]|uniref:Outer membrane protein assembly factor BamA n=1 Tax=Neisseria chenwenguii TaxID=1853278 RepID=A0A220S184_9NEIS|nr:outer membrane protein assembly factor BamA [Neisseria chenwenguii]ASK27224.1 outer membrane protein assembly factor BamA [Neisseria chenwenguii]ROV54831.1 outer membrane protein assembly factor BamA [Neisseria chenwenguii]